MRKLPATRTPSEDTAATTTAAPAPAPAPTAPAREHYRNPWLARALLAAWSGDRFVQIASPPGAGKTTLITELAEQLLHRAGLLTAVAAQTRAQALDVANRLGKVMAATGTSASDGADSDPLTRTPEVALLGKDKHRPSGLAADVAFISDAGLRNYRGVVVATTARWQVTNPAAWPCDVLLVDEAWQATAASLLALGSLAPQVVCVGDPGQIRPVVTGSVHRWRTWAAGPHQPAPDAFAARYGAEHVTKQRLPYTWRLGPETTALIQPAFYPDLPFTSARPERYLTAPGEGTHEHGQHDQHGARLPELSARTVATSAGPSDPALPAAAAARVRELLHCAVVDAQHPGGRPLTAHDVAVITPHVDQQCAVAAHLADLPDVLCVTTNAAQGLEREAVVVIHPLAGYREAPEFAVDPGRLCVALSRHRSHATVLCDPHTSTVLNAAQHADPDNTDLLTQQHVLAHLLARR
ncbi:AAA family ATPase [Kineococcus sp. SYSU DK005]|uniref:AAA family ATPase n=1 Tax=Kineococcus sp. SYSU DK005 TaxID=3383126 RepID=UPI003D7DDA85